MKLFLKLDTAVRHCEIKLDRTILNAMILLDRDYRQSTLR